MKKLYLDIETLLHRGTTITRNVLHRPRALQKTVMLMIEANSIDPIGTVEE